MKKEELKQLIRPLVKECVKESVSEILLESGLLSQVISEVVKGMSPVITEQKSEVSVEEKSRYAEIVKRSENKKIDESKKQLLDKIGKTSYGGVNVFENVSPLPKEPQAGSPLSGIPANEAGIDISGLFDFNKAKILAQGRKKNN